MIRGVLRARRLGDEGGTGGLAAVERPQRSCDRSREGSAGARLRSEQRFECGFDREGFTAEACVDRLEALAGGAPNTITPSSTPMGCASSITARNGAFSVRTRGPRLDDVVEEVTVRPGSVAGVNGGAVRAAGGPARVPACAVRARARRKHRALRARRAAAAGVGLDGRARRDGRDRAGAIRHSRSDRRRADARGARRGRADVSFAAPASRRASQTTATSNTRRGPRRLTMDIDDRCPIIRYRAPTRRCQCVPQVGQRVLLRPYPRTALARSLAQRNASRIARKSRRRSGVRLDLHARSRAHQ